MFDTLKTSCVFSGVVKLYNSLKTYCFLVVLCIFPVAIDPFSYTSYEKNDSRLLVISLKYFLVTIIYSFSICQVNFLSVFHTFIKCLLLNIYLIFGCSTEMKKTISSFTLVVVNVNKWRNLVKNTNYLGEIK